MAMSVDRAAEGISFAEGRLSSEAMRVAQLD
jgi:hypothetical protein